MVLSRLQIVVNWVFFQVSIAVLLDNFLAASNDMKAAERLKLIQETQAQQEVCLCPERCEGCIILEQCLSVQ